MTCTEDQFRSILRMEAGAVTADSIPPLSLTDGHPTPRSPSKGPARAAAGSAGWYRSVPPPR